MDYISLNDFKLGWIFRHRELPVPSEHLELIRPMAKASANQFWKTHISKEASHASHFMSDDWPSRNGVWEEAKEPWEPSWESDDSALPEAMAAAIPWEANVTVYYCYDMDNVIQTRWDIFCQHWKNFLFMDDHTLLLAKGRQDVVQFFSDGTYQLGKRPK